MKFLLCTIIFGLVSASLMAQSDSTNAEAATDSAAAGSTLTLGAVYSTNASYYGQKAAEKMPYVALAATYRLRSGIYFSGMGYKLLNDSAKVVSASSIGAGIGFNISKKLSADISYTHIFYPSQSPFLQAANADNASAALTYENWLSSSVNVDYAFGKTQDIFVTAGTARLIKLGSFSENDLISITPAIDIVGGTQHFYETYITEKRLRDSIMGIQLPPVFGSPSNENISTKTTTSFNILSYNFKLPLDYSRASYMLEAAYQLSMLGDKVDQTAGKINSFLSFSFYYQF